MEPAPARGVPSLETDRWRRRVRPDSVTPWRGHRLATVRNPESDGVGATEDASERTRLASERTRLAWWRTGLTALAVALAIGRIVPELSSGSSQWPYSVVGVGFAVYGIALIVYGNARARRVDMALNGGVSRPADTVLTALTFAGVALAVMTAVLIVAA